MIITQKQALELMYLKQGAFSLNTVEDHFVGVRLFENGEYLLFKGHTRSPSRPGDIREVYACRGNDFFCMTSWKYTELMETYG